MEKLKRYDLNCNVFDVYDYDGLSMQELLCQFFTKINECVDFSNSTLDLCEWLVNEGLKKEVAIKLSNWLSDGTLENLINVTLFENLNNKIDNVSSQLEHKVNYITPQMFGAKGDGVTDDSEAFKQLLNVYHANKDIIIPQGHYIIKTNEKLTLRSIEGQGHTPPVIEFTHEDGGFITGINTTSEKFSGIGNIVNIAIYGGHVCKNLITCGYMSEGQFKGVRFGYCTESVFNINGMLELIVFDNCICSVAPIMFDVKSSAMQYNALNGITLNNGNYWMVGKLVHTTRGGNITISNSWMEKVEMLLVNTSNEGFSILTDGLRFTHTVTGTSNIIKTSNRGANKFIFSNSFFYFSQSVDSFIHFDKGDNLECSSSIIVFNSNDLGSATDKLAKIVTVNDELSKKYNISVSLFNNSVSFSSNYYNDLQSAFDSGLRVHGFDDVKKGLGLVKPSLFLKSNDGNSLIEYDVDNKRIVTSDTYNINKYPFLLGRGYDTPPNNPVRGMMIYYAPLSKPLWYSGVDWRDANGTVVSTS